LLADQVKQEAYHRKLNVEFGPGHSEPPQASQSPQSGTTLVNAAPETVWDCWTNPKHIPGWSFASEDWEAYDAENDLQKGGRFKTTMAAKDKSFSFDFIGTYTEVEAPVLLTFVLDDQRRVRVEFTQTPDGVRVVETFDAEDQNPPEMQQAGWQAFLENFRKYAESH
jgi:uncharacterized protein YndB with AHSA1/START domain